MEAEEPVYLCVTCLERKPLDEFRRRSRGSDKRHHECKACAARYMREWRAARRRKRLDDAVVQLHRYRESPGQLEHLAAVVIAAFHGAAGFAAEYCAAFDDAREAGDHRAVLKYLMGIADLTWGAERIRARRKIAEARRKLRRAAERRASRRDEDDEDELVPAFPEGW